MLTNLAYTHYIGCKGLAACDDELEMLLTVGDDVGGGFQGLGHISK